MVSDFPQVSKWAAFGLGGGFAFSYIASLYIFKAGRLVFTARAVEVGPGAERARTENERWRNDPSVIRARLAGVSLSTLASCGAVFAILRAPNDTVRARPNPRVSIQRVLSGFKNPLQSFRATWLAVSVTRSLRNLVPRTTSLPRAFVRPDVEAGATIPTKLVL
jgi:hypothetical protein